MVLRAQMPGDRIAGALAEIEADGLDGGHRDESDADGT